MRNAVTSFVKFTAAGLRASYDRGGLCPLHVKAVLACPAESLVLDVARSVLASHGKDLTAEVQRVAIGRTPIDAWQATIDALGMQGVTAQQLFNESEPLLKAKCKL